MIVKQRQKWIKNRLVFVPDGSKSWMLTHASNPVAKHVIGDIFKVYFSSRDKENKSSIGFIEINLNEPFKILHISEEPVLSPGELGTFDDSGASLACITKMKNKSYLYYIGWNLGVTVPWRNSIGLAILNEVTRKFEKYSKAPIMDRSIVDPYSISYPFVLQDKDKMKMWYGSNLSWGKEQKDMAHVIKYAESVDGINWERKGIICINFKSSSEYALSKPCVVKEMGIYKMWYSYRGASYRISYAESNDGINWIRKDGEIDLDVSGSGWDSEMIEYPFVFDHKGKRYMLYNGNSYGKTGFGLATLES